MTPILNRLQSCGIELPPSCDETTRAWTFTEKINQKTPAFFQELVKNHVLLSIEYQVHCANLARDLAQKGAKAVTSQLKSALILAELLEHLYRRYLDAPLEAATMEREQNVYRRLLAQEGYQFFNQDEESDVTCSFSKSVREYTISANLSRLFLSRVRRLLVCITLVANNLAQFNRFVSLMDEIAMPMFSYLSWIFFIPRLVTNLFLTAKHLIPGEWMCEQEKALGWKTRFRAQMQQRWFELGNDLGSFVTGLINCFVLIGVLSPIGLYVSFGLQIFDLALISICAYVEINRLKNLQKQYEDTLQNSPNLEDKAELEGYLFHLKARIAFEQKRLFLQVIQNAILLVAISLALAPLALLTPVFPLVGAVIALLATIACYAAVKWVRRQKPEDKIDIPDNPAAKASALGMFSPPKRAITEQAQAVSNPIITPCVAAQEGSRVGLSLGL